MGWNALAYPPIESARSMTEEHQASVVAYATEFAGPGADRIVTAWSPLLWYQDEFDYAFGAETVGGSNPNANRGACTPITERPMSPLATCVGRFRVPVSSTEAPSRNTA